jgi:hypothetical protein
MTLLTLTLRERLGVFVAAAAVSLTMFVLFVIGMLDQVKAAISSTMPIPNFYKSLDAFGITQLVKLIWDVGKHAVPIDLSPGVLYLWLCLGSLVSAFLLANHLPALRETDTLEERALNCLVVGCLLVAGCYLAGPSIGYRALFLMFILPSVLILADRSPKRKERWFWLGVAVLLLSQLWMLLLGMWVARYGGWFSEAEGVLAGPRIALVFVVFREAVWWSMATLFQGVVFRWAFRSPALTGLRALIHRMVTPDDWDE